MFHVYDMFMFKTLQNAFQNVAFKNRAETNTNQQCVGVGFGPGLRRNRPGFRVVFPVGPLAQLRLVAKLLVLRRSEWALLCNDTAAPTQKKAH